jgi:murein L,D-transpeptidase YafK
MTRKRTAIFLLLIISTLIVYYFFPEKKLDTNKTIDKIVVLKSKRILQVYSNNELLKEYKISLGRKPIGAKHFEADDKTPEGKYIINNKNPNSGYHLNLGISYPAKADILFAQSKGKHPGGLIKIHGLKNDLGFIGKFHRWFDWTHGCIALTNKEIEELYRNVKIGTAIELRE